jgi:hypothetical protein
LRLSHQSISNIHSVISQYFVKLILQFLQQSAVLEFGVCVDGHAFVAIKRANRIVQTKQFCFQIRVVHEEFDVEVADTAEDFMVRVAGDNVGFPFAL